MGDDSRTVLVVDDEERLADLFATWLGEDWDVRVAYDGEEALDRIDDEVGIVLLDRRMPGMSGDDVLEEIRERHPDARVIMVTAVDPDFDIIDLGFDDYVVKPVSREDLVGVVEKMADLADYDEDILDFYSVAAKKGLLEAEKPAAELDDNAEYATLVDDFDSLRERVDRTVAGLRTPEDFASAFRGLTPDGEPNGEA